ncbi:MAG: methylmalonyl-CoA mutase [Opitutaceae bacterium]|nr:methylmalonyl-CoA mutase [Opitutaceae bacterium]
MNTNEDFRRWENEILRPFLAQAPERAEQFATGSGLELPRLAVPAEPTAAYSRDLGFPGEFPFTRGITPTMYRGRLWTFRQYAGFSTATEANRRYRYLLEQGTTGLSVAFDLPTQLGLDSSDPMSAGEVGRVGVAIDTLADMERLFAGIPLDRVSTSMTINATAPILLAMYAVVAERQGVPIARIRGTLQNDILKEYIARGTYIFPPAPSLRLVSDVIAWCAREAPDFNPISISGYHIREAGSTAVQEVAFTLGNAIAYIERALAAGQRLEDFGPKLSFFFCVTSDVLEEVAKFRAARRLYARIIRDRFRCDHARCQMLRFHTQTAGHTLTAQQPDVNIVRVTLQALAAVLGGTQSLHTNARDEALALPTEAAAALALRTQQVLAYESGLAQTVDPLGGSFLIEQLTDEIERQAAALIAEIDGRGGMGPAVADGWVQSRIEEAAYRHQCQIESGERQIVGVNCAVAPETATPPVFAVDPAVEARQQHQLAETLAARDAAAVRESLARLDVVAAGRENVMPALLDAVRRQATVGEICAVLRGRFGVHQPSV